MKRLMIIGAGFLQTFVIKKAKDLGYYVISVDGNPYAEGFEFCDEYKNINIIDEEACLEYAKQIHIDGVMTAATDFGVLTASYIAQELELPGISYDVAKLIKNKYLVRKRLYEYKVDDTDQTFEISDQTNYDLFDSEIKYPVMVKPCDGSGSRGASKVSCKEELQAACAFAIENSVSRKAEIETFIIGEEYGVESLVESGNIHIMGIMKKWMTKPPYYAELGHAIPSGLSDEIEMKIQQYVTNAIKALGITFGAVNMDLLITENLKVHIVDVGARMGGNLIGSHIIKTGTGVDYLENLIRITTGDSVEWNPKYSAKAVVTRLLALDPGVVIGLPDFVKIESENNVEIQHHLHIGDVINEYQTNLDGCGYVIGSGSELSQTIDLVENVRQIINEQIQRRKV